MSQSDGKQPGMADRFEPQNDIEQRLVRMFGADEVRIFGGHDVRFECRCSRERVANMLRSLGVEEVRSVIAEVVRRLQLAVRPYDIVGRWGGEELVVLAPNVPDDEALRVISYRYTVPPDLY